MRKISQILLIDADQIGNYLIESVINEVAIAEEVHIEICGKNALNYLLTLNETEYRRCPELIIFNYILSDMRGSDFIKSLNKIGFANIKQVVFIVLASEPNMEHIRELQTLGVHKFSPKPLLQDPLLDVYYTYFAANRAKKPN